MKRIKFKTIHKTKMADTITPVGLYLRFRDTYANTCSWRAQIITVKKKVFLLLPLIR